MCLNADQKLFIPIGFPYTIPVKMTRCYSSWGQPWIDRDKKDDSKCAFLSSTIQSCLPNYFDTQTSPEICTPEHGDSLCQVDLWGWEGDSKHASYTWYVELLFQLQSMECGQWSLQSGQNHPCCSGNGKPNLHYWLSALVGGKKKTIKKEKCHD